jgi:hypothetical protein
LLHGSDVTVDYTIVLDGMQDSTQVQTLLASTTTGELGDQMRLNLEEAVGSNAYDVIVLDIFETFVVDQGGGSSTTATLPVSTSTATGSSTTTQTPTHPLPLPLSPTGEAQQVGSNSLLLVLTSIGGCFLVLCVVAMTTSHVCRPKCQQGAILCLARRPVVGDHVHRFDGGAVSTMSGWILEAGAVAVVESVDAEGDFALRNPAGRVSEVLYRDPYAFSEATVPYFEWVVPAALAKVTQKGRKLASQEFHLECASCALCIWYYPKGTGQQRLQEDGSCSVYVWARGVVPETTLRLAVNGNARMVQGPWTAREHRGYASFCAAPNGDVTLRVEPGFSAKTLEQVLAKGDECLRELSKQPSCEREASLVVGEACPGAGVGSLEEVPLAAAPAAVLCSLGHPMLPRARADRACDACGSLGTSFRCMMGCDYDICMECNQLNLGPMNMCPWAVECDRSEQYPTSPASEENVSYLQQLKRLPEGCIIRLNREQEGVEERIMDTCMDVHEHARFVV